MTEAVVVLTADGRAVVGAAVRAGRLAVEMHTWYVSKGALL